VLLVWYAPYFILGATLGLIRNLREAAVLAPLLAVALTLAAHTAETRGAFVTWTSTACVLVALVLLVSGLLVPGSGSRLSRYATVLGLASFPLYLLNLRFGGLVVGALESRGVAVPLAVGSVAALLLVLACLWATRVEPHLQRRLRAALTSGLRELCETHPRSRGGGVGRGRSGQEVRQAAAGSQHSAEELPPVAAVPPRRQSSDARETV
jgi:peptidoglycan/LPS O-acetylase OafA/YrhL